MRAGTVIIFSKFSNDRRREFSIRTDILEEDGVRTVRKYPANEAAVEHVLHLSKIAEMLKAQYAATRFLPAECHMEGDAAVFAYIPGTLLESEADRMFEEDEEKAAAFVSSYFNEIERMADRRFFMTDRFSEVFGFEEVPDGEKCCAVTNIDLVFGNIVVNGGRWNVIDYEWTFDFPIPVRFVEWRVLHNYLYENTKRAYLTGKGLFERFGFTAEETEVFGRMENHFQQYVLGDCPPVRGLYKDIMKNAFSPYPGLRSIFEPGSSEHARIRVFIDRGNGFGKEADALCVVSEDGRVCEDLMIAGAKEVRFELLPDPVFMEKIRIYTEHAFIPYENLMHDGYRIDDTALVFMERNGSFAVRVADETAKKLHVEFSLTKMEEGTVSIMRTVLRTEEEKCAYLSHIAESESLTLRARRDEFSALRDSRFLKVWRKAAAEVRGCDPLAMLRDELDPAGYEIRHTVDQIFYRKDTVVLRGWAYAAQAPGETLRILRENGEEIPSQVERTRRDDVNRAFNVPYERVTGFLITIPSRSIENGAVLLEADIPQGYARFRIEIEPDREKRREKLMRIMRGEAPASEMRPLDYDEYFALLCAGPKALAEQRTFHFPYEPKISIAIPLYNTPIPFLQEICDSVVTQTYANVELCLADGSTDPAVEQFIRKTYRNDRRVRYMRLKENRGISENTNEAIRMATGDFLMLSDHDDVLEPDACFEIVKAINLSGDVDAVYTDEDKVAMDGSFLFDPHFKPDYSLDYLCNNNYICHIFAARMDLVKEVGLLRSEYDGAQDYDFILRCCEKARRVEHVPKVLYHWRSHPNSTAGNPESKSYAYNNGCKAVQAHYDRAGIRAAVSRTKDYGRYRSALCVEGTPLVSVVIGDPDHNAHTKRLLSSVLMKTGYEHYEIIIAGNDPSAEPSYREDAEGLARPLKTVIRSDMKDLAGLFSEGAKCAEGEYLVFLGPDMEAVSPDWMSELLSYCQREDVGVCGAKAVTADEKIAHCGYILGMCGLAGSMFRGAGQNAHTYTERGNSTQNLCAVSMRCMMTKTELFRRTGGFAASYPDELSGIDYCLRVREEGLLIVENVNALLRYVPGDGQDAFTVPEDKAFRKQWSVYFEKADPYFNPNLDPQRTDFAFIGQYLRNS